MTLKEIEKMIKDFEKSSLRELELEIDGIKLKLSKNENKIEKVLTENKFKENLTEKEAIEPVINYPHHNITSPLVGTFYSKSSPESEPYVKVGDRINIGDTLCIVEAMKIMNEITSDVAGIIEKINFNDGDVVGFNDPIMVVVKDGN